MTKPIYVDIHQKLMSELKEPQKIKELQGAINKAIVAKGLQIEQLKEDGLFGAKSRAALNQLRAVFGLKIKNVPTLLDLRVLAHPFSLQIVQEHLQANEYFEGDTAKKGIVLHHTVSDGNPHTVKNHFDSDDRGRVATHFVIGGTMREAQTAEAKNRYDGKILQLFPLEDFGAHLLTSSNGRLHDATTIGVEICRFGGLKKNSNGRYLTAYGQEIDPIEVEVLKKKFNGYQHFHCYTPKQCEVLVGLLCYLRDIFEFDFSQIDPDGDFFNLDMDMIQNKRVRPLTPHTAWRKPNEKSDIYPAARMIAVLQAVKQSKSHEQAIALYHSFA